MTEPASTAQLLEQGLFHHRQGNFALAMERYTEVLRRDPRNPDALYYIAVVACQDGQYQQGAELARRAIAVGPPQARVHNLLGQALYRLGQPLAAGRGPPTAAGARPPPAPPSASPRRRRVSTTCSARRCTGWASRWRRSRISTRRSRSMPISPTPTATAPTS